MVASAAFSFSARSVAYVACKGDGSLCRALKAEEKPSEEGGFRPKQGVGGLVFTPQRQPFGDGWRWQWGGVGVVMMTMCFPQVTQTYKLAVT